MTHPVAGTPVAGPTVAPPIAAPGRLRPPPDPVREVEVDGCLSLYRRDVDRVLVLNETASDVWRLADGTLDDDRIIELLADAYRLEPHVIADEVRVTLARLVQEGFLTVDLR